MPNDRKTSHAPHSTQLIALAESWRSLASELDQTDPDPQNWPTEQLRLAEEYGINHWFVPRDLGGWGWSSVEIMEGYLLLSAACLTSTFIVTQRAAAIRRIVVSSNVPLRTELLEQILSGQSAATVGISHLTTSRRHLDRPVLRATETELGYVLNGYSPWVTGAGGAGMLVIGANDKDGKQILLAIPSDASGVKIEPGLSLTALTGSQTGLVRFEQVAVGRERLLNGPSEDVLTTGAHSATGSFQTSGLAIGLASAAIVFLQAESERRPELVQKFETLQQQWLSAQKNLLAHASGNPPLDYSSEQLRIDANSLVLRATQAAMVAAKGTGYVAGHPVSRWCSEALFFLVWSCPPAVANANLCELVQL